MLMKSYKQPTISKGKPFGRIIRTIVRDGREFTLHATKGWRSHRVATK